MNILSKIISVLVGGFSKPKIKPFNEQDRRFAIECAQRTMSVIVESLDLAKSTKNQDTRNTRLATAKESISRLKQMQLDHACLKFPTLSDIESEIQNIESSAVTINTQSVRRDTVFSVHGAGNTSAFTSGHIFYATLQLDTPLKVLLRHGEVYEGCGNPPCFADSCDGFWFPKTKSWHEMGINHDEFTDFDVATDIGLRNPEEYLPFLIEVRATIESDKNLPEKIESLRAVLRNPKFAKFVRKHKGQSEIIDRFFPPIISTIPGVNAPAIAALREARITTVGKLKKKTDKDLLALKGIGPSALQRLREFAGGYTGDEKAERTEIQNI